MSFFEQPVILSVKKEGPAFMSKPVPYVIAKDTANGNHAPKNHQVEKVVTHASVENAVNEHPAVDACHKEQAVARKEEAEHEAGLGKNNEQQNPYAAV